MLKALFLFPRHEHNLLEKANLVGLNRVFGFAMSCLLLSSLKIYIKILGLCIENILCSECSSLHIRMGSVQEENYNKPIPQLEN